MYNKSWIPYGHIKVKRIAHASGAFFDCIPALGGHIFRLSLHNGHQVHSIIDPDQDPESYQEYYSKRFHGSKLFPFPNRLDNGKYGFNDQKFKFVKVPFQGPHAIHGLLSHASFREFATQQTNEISLSSTLNHNTYEGYPFKVRCNTLFRLEPERLTINTYITNLSNSEIPVGDGWHPYFNIGDQINPLILKLPKVQSLKLNNDGIPTGKYANFDKFSTSMVIANEQLDHAFKIDHNSKIANTILENRETNLRLVVGQETGHKKYNYLQIFTPPDRKSIAIEPMSCAPNAFNNLMGLLILKREETISLKFSISIQPIKN